MLENENTVLLLNKLSEKELKSLLMKVKEGS